MLSLVVYVIHSTSVHAMQRKTTWELTWLCFHHDCFPIRSKLSQGILISPKVLAWLRGPIIRLTNFDAGSVCLARLSRMELYLCYDLLPEGFPCVPGGRLSGD